MAKKDSDIIGETGHTRAELKAMIEDMNHVTSWFYRMATQIGNHPFIEFTGLMNEYIRCCEGALANDVDFSECNTHGGKELPMTNYQVDYTNEKLECIYTGRSVIKLSSIYPGGSPEQVVADAQQYITTQCQTLIQLIDAVSALEGQVDRENITPTLKKIRDATAVWNDVLDVLPRLLKPARKEEVDASVHEQDVREAVRQGAKGKRNRRRDGAGTKREPRQADA